LQLILRPNHCMQVKIASTFQLSIELPNFYLLVASCQNAYLGNYHSSTFKILYFNNSRKRPRQMVKMQKFQKQIKPTFPETRPNFEKKIFFFEIMQIFTMGKYCKFEVSKMQIFLHIQNLHQKIKEIFFFLKNQKCK